MNNIIKRVWIQNRLVNIEDLTGMVFQAEIGAHTFEISGIDDTGAAVALSGTVSGVFRRPDNADIALTGAASGGVVSVTLPADCYAVPGRFGLTIFVTSNSQKVAVYACVGTVAVSSTGNVAGDTPASVEDLIDDINAAIADLNSAIGQIPASYANVMAAIAPTYSGSALYSVGAYAWYNGSLYRCTTPITTAEAWTAAHWTAAVLGDDVGDLMNRMEDIDGYYYLDPNNFEIGTMQISASGWNYPSNNTKRVRTKEGVTYHLSVGDVISLSDYTDARFYLGWKNGNNEYKYAGWETEDYTATEAGDYVILLANVTEVDQTSIYALFNLLSIKTSNYTLKNIDNEFMEQDAKRLDSFLYDRMGIPFTVNEAYISNEFKANPNRVSFEVPYPFNKGSKIDITVGTGEKFYMMYFRKVNNTGNKNTDYEYISGSGTGWQTTSKSYTATEDVYVYVMAAFTGDTRITKDTVNTKAVETKAYARADVDELPAYWKTYLQTKNGEINAAMDDIGGIGDAFVFYTDPHWGSKNQKHTPKIIQNMLENTALRSVYCGGDVIDSGSGGFTEYCKAFRGIDVFTARGNHDQNPNAQDASDIVPDSEYYNRILKPIEYLVNTEGRLYFYRDNASEKIRYIFMDSGSARADTLDTAQLTWMQNALTELESDWSALVIQHVVFTGAEASSTAPLNLAGQGIKTINAINEVWNQMQCTFIGIVCGHVHRDYATTDSTNGYPIIATSCDVGGTGRTQYDPVNGATPGTTDEQIMDVFLIDKENKTINTIRIGAGQNRAFSYGN